MHVISRAASCAVSYAAVLQWRYDGTTANVMPSVVQLITRSLTNYYSQMYIRSTSIVFFYNKRESEELLFSYQQLNIFLEVQFP